MKKICIALLIVVLPASPCFASSQCGPVVTEESTSSNGTLIEAPGFSISDRLFVGKDKEIDCGGEAIIEVFCKGAKLLFCSSCYQKHVIDKGITNEELCEDAGYPLDLRPTRRRY